MRHKTTGMIGLVMLIWGLALAVNSPAHAKGRPPWKRHGRKVKVKINTTPPGAVVYIEDKKWGPVGTTPTRWIRLPRNSTYKIIIEHPQMETLETYIQLGRRYRNRFNFTLKRKVLPAKLELQSNTDGSATGAGIFLDGKPQGTIPASLKLKAGKYMLKIQREGYNPYQTMLELAEGETRTLVITLVKIEKPKGKLLVTSDLPNAQVFIDKKFRGATPLLTELEPGSYLVEVRPPAGVQAQPWQSVVEIKPNDTSKVIAAIKPQEAPSQVGMVRVISNAPESKVFVDGESKGQAPITVKLVPGQHLIEVRAKGFRDEKRTVTIEAGKQTLENFELKVIPKEPPTGTLTVVATPPGTQIYIDGQLKGNGSATVPKLPVGTHIVMASKAGYKTYTKSVEVQEGKSITLQVNLQQVGTIKVIANVPGAQVFIDQKPVGRVPLTDYELPVGVYRLDIDAKGYRPYSQTIKVEGGKLQTINVNLLTEGLTPTEIRRMKTGLTPFGAKVIPQGSFTASVGTGWPWLIEARSMVGIKTRLPWAQGHAIDGGVIFRSFFQLSEILFRARYQFFNAYPFALGAFTSFGGGLGVDQRNSLTGDLGLAFTISFMDKANLSFVTRFDWYGDRFCPSSSSDQEPGYCPNTEAGEPSDLFDGINQQPAPFTGKNLRDRYWGWRFLISIAFDWALNRRTSIYGRAEWVPPVFSSHSEDMYRPAFMDAYYSFMVKEDPLFYFNMGATFKF